jgi:GTP-binding protein EngB required for normal cell division
MDSDKMLIKMLSESYRPFMIVLTKADKLAENQIEKKLSEVAEFIKNEPSLCSPIIHAVSAQ